MKQIILLFLSLVALAGCHTGKSAAERAAEKRAKFVADSLKYEAIKDDFMKGQFIFRVNRHGNKLVNQGESYIVFYEDKIRYQIVSEMSMGAAHKALYYGPINTIEKTTDSHKQTITLTGSAVLYSSGISAYAVVFSFTLYDGSNKGYGFIGNYTDFAYEGWYEPITDANISTYLPIQLENRVRE